MVETDVPQPSDSAEKAYAAAAEAVSEKEPTKQSDNAASADPVKFPAKPKRARLPAVSQVPSVELADERAPAKAAPKPRARAAPKVAKAAKPAAKLAVKRRSAKSAPAKLRKPAVRKVKAAAKISASVSPKIPFIAQLKEFPMEMTSSVKDAFAKTSAAAGGYGEFAKGNVEAFVESGKILASGLQGLGSTFVADSKAAFETMTGEVKELAAVKSPADFFKLQTELLRRNLDSAVAYGSKTSEAMFKLTNDVIAPLSGRVNLAIEKVRKAA